MAFVRAIEFDKSEFKTLEDCVSWLRESPHSYLINLKGFLLRPRKQAFFLSFEKRPVWYYTAQTELWRETKLAVKRPVRGVCVIEGASEGTLWTEASVPDLLPATKEKRELADKKKEETLRKQAERKEEMKRRRAEGKKRKSPEKDDSPTQPKRRVPILPLEIPESGSAADAVVGGSIKDPLLALP